MGGGEWAEKLKSMKWLEEKMKVFERNKHVPNKCPDCLGMITCHEESFSDREDQIKQVNKQREAGEATTHICGGCDAQNDIGFGKCNVSTCNICAIKTCVVCLTPIKIGAASLAEP